MNRVACDRMLLRPAKNNVKSIFTFVLHGNQSFDGARAPRFGAREPLFGEIGFTCT